MTDALLLPTRFGPWWDIAEEIFEPLDFLFRTRPPARRYIHVGNLVEDFDDQLIVQLENVSFGLASNPAFQEFKVGSSITANYAVWLLRELPKMDDAGTPPTPESLSDTARGLMEEGWLIMSTLVNLVDKGDLVTACSDITLGTMEARGGEEGLGGWRLPISVTL